VLKIGVPDPTIAGLLIASGTTVPTDAAAGYQTGCLFLHTDGSTGTAVYINEGSVTSCDFNAVAALTAAQEALISATAGTATASKAVILDANAAIDAVKTAALSVGVSGSELPVILADMTPGTGISTGTNTICQHRVTKVGGLFKTEILVDLTGLNSGGSADDIIGKDGGTANCHIGQITAAVNGTIVAGRMTCFETPAGGDDDVDVYSSTAATGAEDAGAGALAGSSKLLNAGDSSAGSTDVFTALPAANSYLYLAGGTGGDATYTAGVLLIELWGV